MSSTRLRHGLFGVAWLFAGLLAYTYFMLDELAAMFAWLPPHVYETEWFEAIYSFWVDRVMLVVPYAMIAAMLASMLYYLQSRERLAWFILLGAGAVPVAIQTLLNFMGSILP